MRVTAENHLQPGAVLHFLIVHTRAAVNLALSFRADVVDRIRVIVTRSPLAQLLAPHLSPIRVSVSYLQAASTARNFSFSYQSVSINHFIEGHVVVIKVFFTLALRQIHFFLLRDL